MDCPKTQISHVARVSQDLKQCLSGHSCPPLQAAPAPVKVSDFLKDTDPRGHAWKYMRASPDGQELYIAVGSPCNKCVSPFFVRVLQ